MNTSGSSFETIFDEILKQKQLLEDLQAENESLRQQLTDLRAGRGIFLDILGQRFPLTDNSNVSSLAIVSNEVVKDDTAPVPAAILTAQAETAQQETAAIQNEALSPPSETPIPSDDFLVEEVSENDALFPVPASSTFLEEAMIDEFSAASTQQMGVWSGPITNHPTLDEDEKATLRRELMGSFLLE